MRLHRLVLLLGLGLVSCKKEDAPPPPAAPVQEPWVPLSELTLNIETKEDSPAQLLAGLNAASAPRLGAGLAPISAQDFWKSFATAVQEQGGVAGLPTLPPEEQEITVLTSVSYGQEMKVGERIKVHTRGFAKGVWHQGLVAMKNPSPEDRESFLKLLRSAIRALEGQSATKERAVLAALGLVGGTLSDGTKHLSDRYEYKVSVISLNSKVSSLHVRISPKAQNVAPGKRSWFRVESARDGVHGFLGSYSLLVDPNTKGKPFFAAADACEQNGMVLCTAPQWRAACHLQPSLGKVETWTASLTADYNGHQLQGGQGKCDATGSAGSQDASAERYGVCCSPAIAFGDRDKDMVRLLPIKLLEEGTNAKSSEVLGNALAERVPSFYTLADVPRPEAVKSVMSHVSAIPDYRIRHEHCTLENVSTRTARFTCEKLAFWDEKAMVTRSEYITDGTSLLYARDPHVLRKHRAVDGPPQRDGVEAPSHPVIARWLSAQNSGDFDAYSKLYGPDFQGVKNVGGTKKHFDRQGWLNDRKGMFANSFSVESSDVKAEEKDGVQVITFTQTWKSSNYGDQGTKVLHVRDGKVVREEQLDSSPLLPGPTDAQWAAVKEVTVKGSSALKCETKVLDGYFRAVCGENDGGEPTGVSFVGASSPNAIARVEDGKLVLIHPYTSGTEFKALFEWAGKTSRLHVSWPKGAPQPPMVGTFDGPPSGL